MDKRYEEFTRNKFLAKGCKNDAANQIKVCYLKQYTRIWLYDDDFLNEEYDDDYLVLTAMKDMEDCQWIHTLENSSTYGDIETKYLKYNGLNGKVSSMKYFID